MARVLSDVIDEITKILPNDNLLMDRLARRLKDVKESFSFSPPENQAMWWREFEEIINECVPYPPKLPHEKSIFKIVTLKDFDEEVLASKSW